MRGDFHALLGAHQNITRRVELRPDGAETWTTSDDPEVAATIVRHVQQMRDHVSAGGRVRMWDPLFRAVVAHADEMALEIEVIDGGVHVIHRGRTPRAVELIQAHARVVEGFVARGHDEAREEHAVP